jgi:hypothetical protein
LHTHDFIDGFVTDLERIHKRFKEPILGQVELLYIAADVFVPLLFSDISTVLSALCQQAQDENIDLPVDDMFAIYHQTKEAWSLYTQITRKYYPILIEFNFKGDGI